MLSIQAIIALAFAYNVSQITNLQAINRHISHIHFAMIYGVI